MAPLIHAYGPFGGLPSHGIGTGSAGCAEYGIIGHTFTGSYHQAVLPGIQDKEGAKGFVVIVYVMAGVAPAKKGCAMLA